jgi:hypothetical protein
MYISDHHETHQFINKKKEREREREKEIAK